MLLQRITYWDQIVEFGCKANLIRILSMCSGASFRRRLKRYSLSGVKSRNTRRRGIHPWRVVAHGRDLSMCSPEKASKGAEKSFPRTGKTHRGLRSGKVRARGGKPRHEPERQPVRNNVDRAVKHQVRMLEFNRKVASTVIQRFKQAIEKGLLSPTTGHGFSKFSHQWDRIHTMMLRKNRLGADAAMSHSFTAFLETNVGVKVRSRKGHTNAQDSFAALLMSSNLPRKPVENNPPVAGPSRASGLPTRSNNIAIVRGSSLKFCRSCGNRIPREFDCHVCYERQHGLEAPWYRGVSAMTIRDLGAAYRVHRP